MTDRESRDIDKWLTRSPRKPRAPPTGDPIIDLTYELPEKNDNAGYDEDAVYSTISLINGKINQMKLQDLKNQCQHHDLTSQGEYSP